MCRSAARAVRLSGSTRGLLPLYFFVVFYAFYLRAWGEGCEECLGSYYYYYYYYYF
jgi:hypothetical protein